jgi:hypothetical protein
LASPWCTEFTSLNRKTAIHTQSRRRLPERTGARWARVAEDNRDIIFKDIAGSKSIWSVDPDEHRSPNGDAIAENQGFPVNDSYLRLFEDTLTMTLHLIDFHRFTVYEAGGVADQCARLSRRQRKRRSGTPVQPPCLRSSLADVAANQRSHGNTRPPRRLVAFNLSSPLTCSGRSS